MILVAGSTGVLGSEICRRLRERGQKVRGLVRSDSPRAKQLEALGVETVVGDLKDAASLEAACQGVTTVISTANAVMARKKEDNLKNVDREGHLSLLRAAKKGGASHFIYVSINDAVTDSAIVEPKRAIEAALQDSGMRWTVIKPCFFMDLWFSPALGWNLEKGEVTFYGKGDKKHAFISVGDVAEAVVRCVDNQAAHGKVFPISSPPRSQEDAAKAYEAAAGKSLKIKRIPAIMPNIMRTVMRPFNPVMAGLMSFGADLARGFTLDTSEADRVLKLKYETVEDFAKQATKRA